MHAAVPAWRHTRSRLHTVYYVHNPREYYTIEHLRRLVRWEARGALSTQGRQVLCKDVHGPGCKACVSCHFCRWGAAAACGSLCASPG